VDNLGIGLPPRPNGYTRIGRSTTTARSNPSQSQLEHIVLCMAPRRLEERGELSSAYERRHDAGAGGREAPRRYYQLTATGVELAASELASHQLSWVSCELIPLPARLD
jgi:hypothetical protein